MVYITSVILNIVNISLNKQTYSQSLRQYPDGKVSNSTDQFYEYSQGLLRAD